MAFRVRYVFGLFEKRAPMFLVESIYNGNNLTAHVIIMKNSTSASPEKNHQVRRRITKEGGKDEPLREPDSSKANSTGYS